MTVTDANLVLGRLLPASFPCIFGPGEDQPLSPEASRKALEAVATEVNSFLTNAPCPAPPLSLEEVAMGFVRVANEAMCRPIRALTQVRLALPSPRGGGAGRGRPLTPLWFHRHEATTPRPMCWLALGELVGSVRVPSPGR